MYSSSPSGSRLAIGNFLPRHAFAASVLGLCSLTAPALAGPTFSSISICNGPELASIRISEGTTASTLRPVHETSLEDEVLGEINRARQNPARYADMLSRFRPYFRGQVFAVPGTRPVLTHEGLSALDEAIGDLRHRAPVAPLSASNGLAHAAVDHAREQSLDGSVGHGGQFGTSPWARMQRYGTWAGSAGEAIDYGGTTAQRIVFNLLVDDGVRDRGHRNCLMEAGFGRAGIAFAGHPRYGHLCVIDFAGDFVER